MKITNLNHREAYELLPDTKIEVERTNPFFNDYAEQTVPVNIPASPRNCRLLGFPDLFGGRVKLISSDVSIQDGEFHAQCRQAVLSATRRGTIQTTFYINDGSFYSRLQNIKLKDVFTLPEDTITFGTITEAITFCKNLRSNTDSRFSIFPILVTDDSGEDDGFNYKIVNAYGNSVRLTDQTYMFNPDMASARFYNEVWRTETVDGMPITLEPGYYISPFIRACYVLERIFTHFGYTLTRNFFTSTSPFSTMVLLNNVIDTIVNKKIIVQDLVPDVSVADMLALFRKKFCCEFAVDEAQRSVSVVFLKDIIDATPETDLTDRMTEEPTISYKAAKEYGRIVLKADKTLDSEAEDSYDDIKEMVKASPTAYFDEVTGCFFKDGWSGENRVGVKIGEASQSYDTGEGSLEAKEIKIPECIPEFRMLSFTYDFGEDKKTIDLGRFLYVGAYRTVNSKMVLASSDGQEETEDAAKTMPMMAFCVSNSGRATGTITPWAHGAITLGATYNVEEVQVNRSLTRFCNYSLVYNGGSGIFERFYRPYDLLQRNSLQEMKVKLLLSQSEKQNLPAYGKVIIRGVEFFPNKLKFTIGGKDEPLDSELLTVGLYHDENGDIDSAPTVTAMLPIMASAYKWVARSTREPTNDWQVLEEIEDATFKVIYPPMPGPEWVGQRWGERSTYVSDGSVMATWFGIANVKVTVWLECVHK